MDRPADDTASALARAMSLLRAGALDEADLAIDAIRQRAPHHPAAALLKAEVLDARGRAAEALAEATHGMAAIYAVAPQVPTVTAAMLEAIGAHPLARVRSQARLFRLFGTLLAKSLPPAAAAELAASPGWARVAGWGGGEFEGRLGPALALLGFSRSADPHWNRAVFEGAVLPLLLAMLEQGRYGEAFALERHAYESYVKQTESESHFTATVSRWKDAMRAAGARYASTLPRLPRAAPGALMRVAFFVHSVTHLAHVQMVLNLVEGNAELATPRFQPFVFCLVGEPPALERFRRAGAKVEVLSETGANVTDLAALAALRQRIAQSGIDVLVWVSVVALMPFAFAMRLAPAQVWWAMKYHGLDLPEIDGYLTGGGLEGGTKSIGGREWLAGPVASNEWTAPEKAAQAAQVRASIGSYRVVYGCFGREEKLKDAQFLDAVCRVLKAVPDAAFLWTGRVRDPDIQGALEAGGVADRCRYIGWVDTKLYAQVIDVFLDSFPFPCGFTLYEAMAAGKPAVLLANAASADTGANALIGPLLDAGDPGRDAARLARSIFAPQGESLSLRARDADEYVRLAVVAGTDEGLRMRSGRAHREFVERFLADRARAAVIYAGHFESVLAKAAGKPG